MLVGLLNICKIISFGESLTFNYKGPIKCISLNNQPFQDIPTIVNIITVLISANKCGDY